MYEVIVYQVILGAVMGVLIGYIARKSLRWAHDRQYVVLSISQSLQY